MRLFTAIALPDHLRRITASLRRPLEGVMWYPPESYHLTLRFIGEITDGALLEEVDYALSSLTMRSFTLSLSGVGFSSHQTLWAGIAPSQDLQALRSKIETALRRAGLPTERKRFQQHIRLGSFAGEPHDGIIRWTQEHNLLSSNADTIDQFSLFSSLGTVGAPHYELCADYALAGAGRAQPFI